ncbi:hypothetical protein SAMN05421783_103309 [Thiocapsa roseopersicina]|uniref:Type I restriction enzyme, R subunit n=1 Tax=Thiocapsa roseopersicina TaxID=1058 RepID=A0A1H2T618_THIRO|nr:hypothetical protein SAMN05421783_103309 [Thiocapsa roseopersicina]
MNEAETRAEHIDPALKAASWDVAEGSRRVDKRSAVHQHRCGFWWTSLSLVHPTAGMMSNALRATNQLNFLRM